MRMTVSCDTHRKKTTNVQNPTQTYVDLPMYTGLNFVAQLTLST